MEKIVLLLAKELNIKPAQAEAALQLLDDGNTVPFIARYRKEATGSLDEEQIRNLETRAQYLRNLDQRREEILNSIREQEKLTPELEQQIITLHFGLSGKKPMTLVELSELCGLTRERIRQLESRALKKLKDPSFTMDFQDYFS